MSKKYEGRYGGNDGGNSSSIVLVLVGIMVVIVLLSLGLRMILGGGSPAPAPAETEPMETVAVETVPQETQPKLSLWERIFGRKEPEPEPTEPPEPEHVVSEAVLSVTGDILMHLPVITTGAQESGGYNFDSIFRYLSPYSSAADMAIANLETTLAGNDAGYKYSGYPAFNCPDAIVDGLRDAGFDALLTANNHCYDTSEYGFLRTVNTIRSKGLEVMGTQAESGEPKWVVEDFDGIKIGMVCYTYEGQPEKPIAGTVYMNRNALSGKCAGLINSFLPGQLDPFYMEVRQCLADMKVQGADATVIFMHWGTEYQTTPTGEQKEMAQQLCDLGFDVIIGGHPHVIQPVELLTSRLEPEHRTVCLYSTGNAVSNQRIAEMNLKTGHTEDGLLFSVKFTKYSDDTVYLDSVELIPCWVDLRSSPNREYCIIPLVESMRSQWKSLYDLTDEAAANAVKSYDRTTALVGEGMNQANEYLTAQREQREADYLAAVTQLPDAA